MNKLNIIQIASATLTPAEWSEIYIAARNKLAPEDQEIIDELRYHIGKADQRKADNKIKVGEVAAATIKLAIHLISRR